MEQIREDRRRLHQIPEIGLTLPETMSYLKNALSGRNCTLFSPMESSLCAFFDFGREDAIAFRSDCDALPITEAPGRPYASTHPGCMHACGHDGHMAIVLELARRLEGMSGLNHNVLLIFQPGEEGPGGALPICRTGVLGKYNVKAIFGLHIWPGLEKGTIFSRPNELMARASELTVEITGRAAHIAKARDGVDATAAAVEFYRQAAKAEADWGNAFRLLKFGQLHSGHLRNAISGHCRMEGCLRAFQEEVFDGLKARILAIGVDVERQFGCRVEISLSEGYPAVMNPPELYDKVREIVTFSHLDEPAMTAEDFGWYQKYVPGLFFFLGTGDGPALHAPDFDFDESILTKGADFFTELAVKFP